MLRVVALAAAGTVLTALLHAQIPDAERAIVDDYLGAVRSAQAGKGSVEGAYSRVASVCRALARIDDDDAALEAAQDGEIRQLHELPGITAGSRLSSAKPDQQFFSTLAQAHGTAADRQFFQTLNAMSPAGGWAIYLEGVSDFGACTRYGTGSLVEVYRRWSQFQKMYPDHYAQPATHAIDDVAEELTHPLCACGDIGSVTREMESFVRAFPSAPLSRTVSVTARALKADSSTVRTHCRPG